MSRSRWLSFDLSPGFALAAALLYMLDEQGIFALAAVSAAVHELGHYLALSCFGARPYMLRLELTGAVMYFDSGRLKYWQELAAAAAGPAAGLALAFAAAYCGAHELAGVSLMLSVFNLLPVVWMDGGRILSAALSMLADARLARRVCLAATGIAAAALMALGAWLLAAFRGGAAVFLMGVIIILRLLREGING